MTLNNRTVCWEGAVNARDLGGVPTSAGPIKAGRVFRMGRPEWLTEAGWQDAHDDGVRTMVDLRNPDERRRRQTDPDVSDAVLARFSVINTPTEDPADQEFMSTCGPVLNSPEPTRKTCAAGLASSLPSSVPSHRRRAPS